MQCTTWELGHTSTFFSYSGFLYFWQECMILKCWCRGRMGPKEQIGPISFWWCLTPFYTTWNFDFSGTTYCRDSKPAPTGFSMPWTLNMHHSSHFDVFPSQNQQNVKFLPQILIFQELFIDQRLETCTKRNQHTLNLNIYRQPLKPFQWLFPSQNQQNMISI